MLVEHKKVDAVICLGCIIKGETRHVNSSSQAVAKGIMDLNLRYNIHSSSRAHLREYGAGTRPRRRTTW